jgi:hypothetical protein
MAKRFTDTDKWKKAFVRSMKAPYKLLWLYILDECDHAGIWHVDLEVAQIRTGEKLKLDTALSVFKNKIIVFDGGDKWFIPDFISFQYGELNPANRAHNSVIQLLKKYNLIIDNKPLTSPLQGAMDMDKEKEKDMDKDMDKDKEGENENLEKPSVEYPFGERFSSVWSHWKIYKKQEHKFSYKTVQSEQASINELVTLSQGEEQTAIAIINQSMAQGWKGFFELKKEINGNYTSNAGRKLNRYEAGLAGALDDLKADFNPGRIQSL